VQKGWGVHIESNVVNGRWDYLSLDCEPVAHTGINVHINVHIKGPVESRGEAGGWARLATAGYREILLDFGGRAAFCFNPGLAEVAQS
jgi:hypothetical protein